MHMPDFADKKSAATRPGAVIFTAPFSGWHRLSANTTETETQNPTKQRANTRSAGSSSSASSASMALQFEGFAQARGRKTMMTNANPNRSRARNRDHRNRFEHFTDPEAAMLSEALRELLPKKRKALEITNGDRPTDLERPFTEDDFGLSEIEKRLHELEDIL
jgi:hypothetical protein